MNAFLYVLNLTYCTIQRLKKKESIEFDLLYACNINDSITNNYNRDKGELTNRYALYSEEKNVLYECEGLHRFINDLFLCPNGKDELKHFELSIVKISFPENICLIPSTENLIPMSKCRDKIYLHQKLYFIDFKYCLQLFSNFDSMNTDVPIDKLLDVLYFSYIVGIYKAKNFYKILKGYMIHASGNTLYNGINQVLQYKERFCTNYFNWIISRMIEIFYELNFYYIEDISKGKIGRRFDEKATEVKKFNISSYIIEKIYENKIEENNIKLLHFLLFFKEIEEIYLIDIDFVHVKKIFCLRKIFSRNIDAVTISQKTKIGLVLLYLNNIAVFKNIKKLEIRSTILTENNMRLLANFTFLEHIILSDIIIDQRQYFFPKYLIGRLLNLKILNIRTSFIFLYADLVVMFPNLTQLFLTLNKTQDFDNFMVLPCLEAYNLLFKRIGFRFGSANLKDFFNKIYNLKNLEDITITSETISPIYNYNNIIHQQYYLTLKRLKLVHFYLYDYEIQCIQNFRNLKSMIYIGCTFLNSDSMIFSGCKYADSLENMKIINCKNALYILLSIENHKNLVYLTIKSKKPMYIPNSNHWMINLNNNIYLKSIHIELEAFDKLPVIRNACNAKLHYINLGNCNLPGNSIILSFSSPYMLKNIKIFNYFGNFLSKNDLFYLSFMTKCKSLELSFCRLENCKLYDMFAADKLYIIEELYILDIILGKYDFLAIQKLKYLQCIGISLFSDSLSFIYYFKRMYFKRLRSFGTLKPEISLQERNYLISEFGSAIDIYSI
ncbi:hypothetical protein CWI37_0660p0020 [Hamiltosporidium tvaerminnensis]|uniref:Uncharacterized protein n=1 Tax=Hamiltosporidium tvaerminnensis TaxID=1176355 RepID=A0A4Q9L2J0_9MICR|nr:hypothetical protein CWI37_0660p0020 [Hamiltosporidium tvaerminnensis]